MKVSFLLIIDSLFYFFISFVIFFAVFNYFAPKNYAVVCAIFLSIAVTMILAKKAITSNKKISQSKQEETKKNKVITQFNFGTKIEVNEFFEKLFVKNGYVVERKKFGLFIKDKNVAVFPLFGFLDVGKSHVVRVYNSIPLSYTAYILSEKFCSDTVDFAKRFNGKIVLIDKNQVYSYLKEHDFFPSEKYSFPKNKGASFAFFKNFFKKKKAKSFLTFGFLFVLYSFFIPFKLYYILFGCAFLILGLYCKAFGKEENNS
jgi:hypothetical protein